MPVDARATLDCMQLWGRAQRLLSQLVVAFSDLLERLLNVRDGVAFVLAEQVVSRI